VGSMVVKNNHKIKKRRCPQFGTTASVVCHNERNGADSVYSPIAATSDALPSVVRFSAQYVEVVRLKTISGSLG